MSISCTGAGASARCSGWRCSPTSAAPSWSPQRPAGRSSPRAGALLMLLNSAVVAAIGVVVRPVLRRHDETSALAYLVSRVVEAVVLAVGVVLVLRLMPVAAEYALPGPPWSRSG